MERSKYLRLLLALSLFFAASCRNNGDDGPNAGMQKPSPTPSPSPSPSVGLDDGPKDHDDTVKQPEFSALDLNASVAKAIIRFKRVTSAGESISFLKTWKTSDYVWVKVITSKKSTDGTQTDGQWFLACHYHDAAGTDLGCHKKTVGDPSEPEDVPVPDDPDFP